jgi:hypothetical protein
MGTHSWWSVETGSGCPEVSKGVWSVENGAGVLQTGCEVLKGVSWGVECRKRAVGCWNRSGASKTGAETHVRLLVRAFREEMV